MNEKRDPYGEILDVIGQVGDVLEDVPALGVDDLGLRFRLRSHCRPQRRRTQVGSGRALADGRDRALEIEQVVEAPAAMDRFLIKISSSRPIRQGPHFSESRSMQRMESLKSLKRIMGIELIFIMRRMKEGNKY